MRTLDHATATSLSAFAAAVLAVGTSAVAAERFSVRRIAVWLERKSRDDDSYELLRQVAATLEREAFEWVSKDSGATTRLSGVFAFGHLLPTLDPPARVLIDANLDLKRMADIVVECAQSQAPSDFDHDEGDVLTAATSGPKANALVFRVLLLRTFELILADPSYERVLRASFEPRSEDGRIRNSDKAGELKLDREPRRADLKPLAAQPVVPPEPTNSTPQRHEYRPTGQPSAGAILRGAVREAGMRGGGQGNRAAPESRRYPSSTDREQQVSPPANSGGAPTHAEPKQNHDNEDLNVEPVKGASRPYRLPDAPGLAPGPATSDEMRSKLTAPPIESQPSDRSSIRSLSRWLVAILIVSAALAAWIYREEVGSVVAALFDLLRSNF